MIGRLPWRRDPSRRSGWSAIDRQRIAALSRRSQQVVILAGTTGLLVGLMVAGFETVTHAALEQVLNLPLALRAAFPGLGLLVATGCLRLAGRGTTPGSSDEYIRAFHRRRGLGLRLRDVPLRMLAAVATLGSGGSLGYEGPSIYAGAALGSSLQRRLHRFFAADDAKVLMVAGAAAGVSAIFKAPVTGLVFALEVPFQNDLARRMLLPAAISSAASYVVFAAIAGTAPILPIGGQPPFNLVDLGGAAAIGLASGVLARLYILVMARAKRLSTRGHIPLRVAGSGAVIAATVVLGTLLSKENLVLGPGYHALRWSLDPKHAILAIVALGTLRVAGNAAVIAGGGTGGLFVPLVIQGALVGRCVGGVFDSGNASLFPVVGMAAFLGAGYRVPLAGVVFIAEFTGRPGFVVPGLIAAVMAQLVMGRSSLSPYQTSGPVGHLERRLLLPVADLVSSDALSVAPDATVDELFSQHLAGSRQQAVAVVQDGIYLGIASVEDLNGVERAQWAQTRVADIMRTDVPVATHDWILRDAVVAMEEAGTDRIAVCNDGRYVGVITAGDLVRLDDILDRESDR